MTLEVALRHRLGDFALDATFRAEGSTVIFGPSGSGKSSVLLAVAGLLRAREGRVALAGEEWQGPRRFVAPHRRRVGLVFQEARLFPHLSVRGNLRFGARRAPPGATVGEEEVAALLGIGAILDRRPATLSGGERQRVALARALLARPRLLLLDEPLAALDQRRRGEALALIERVRDRFRLPLLHVTHALDEADRLATRLVLMEHGRVLAEGAPEALALRADLPLTLRRDAGALLAVRVAAHDPARGLTRLALPGGLFLDVPGRDEPPGALLRLRLRARDVAIAADGAAPPPLGHADFPATVARLDAREGEALVLLDLGALQILSRLPRHEAAALRPGQAVRALVPRAALDHRGAA